MLQLGSSDLEDHDNCHKLVACRGTTLAVHQDASALAYPSSSLSRILEGTDERKAWSDGKVRIEKEPTPRRERAEGG